MKNILSIPAGTEDVFGSKMVQREVVLSIIRRTYESYGFEALHTPVMEHRSVFEGHHGEGEKIQFHFTDKTGHALMLRYDLTVPLARFVAMHPELPRPFKRYQLAPSFRDDSVDHGHHREFIQCDADVVGAKSLMADTEVIMMAIDGLKRIGLRNFKIRINHRGIIRAMADLCCGFGSDILIVQRALDYADKYVRKGIGGVKEDLLRRGLSKKQVTNILDFLQINGLSAEILDKLSHKFIGHFPGRSAVSELHIILEQLPVSYRKYVSVDIGLARGADYYTGFILEGFIPDISVGAILGGGRYDDLMEKFSGVSEPAVGMAFGLERILDAMSKLHIRIDNEVSTVLVHPAGPDAVNDAGLTAHTLRESGINVDFGHSVYSSDDAKSYASKRGYKAIVKCDGDSKRKAVYVGGDSCQFLKLCGRVLHLA